jgi:putative Holliday junction resolvase
MKYLGIDPGDKKIGLAIADSEIKIASPYKILINNKNIILDIKNICSNEGIDSIIIGVPISLMGNQSKQTKNVLNFITKLRESIEIKIIEQDEQLTSQYAQRLLRETNAKKFDDDVAAMLILQSYLDKQ